MTLGDVMGVIGVVTVLVVNVAALGSIYGALRTRVSTLEAQVKQNGEIDNGAHIKMQASLDQVARNVREQIDRVVVDVRAAGMNSAWNSVEIMRIEEKLGIKPLLPLPERPPLDILPLEHTPPLDTSGAVQ